MKINCYFCKRFIYFLSSQNFGDLFYYNFNLIFHVQIWTGWSGFILLSFRSSETELPSLQLARIFCSWIGKVENAGLSPKKYTSYWAKEKGETRRSEQVKARYFFQRGHVTDPLDVCGLQNLVARTSSGAMTADRWRRPFTEVEVGQVLIPLLGVGSDPAHGDARRVTVSDALVSEMWFDRWIRHEPAHFEELSRSESSFSRSELKGRLTDGLSLSRLLGGRSV